VDLWSPKPVFSSIIDGAQTLDEKAENLIKAALDAGGQDDMTVILAQN